MMTDPDRIALDIGRGEGAASYLRWDAAGDRAPLLHFTHANGFNAGTYRRIIGPLSDEYRIIAPDLRGHGQSSLTADPDTHFTWRTYRDDLIAGVEAMGETPLLLAGHSMGATSSLLTAMTRPDLVRGLVLFEPVILTRFDYWIGWLRHMRRQRTHVVPIAKATLKRRAVWPDRETMVKAYRGRGAFASWPPEIIRDYVEGGTRSRADGSVELSCTPAWEAANFSGSDHNIWPHLRRVRCPVTIVRGTLGSTVREQMVDLLFKRLPQARDIVIDGASHFLPMEHPDVVQREIRTMAGALVQSGA